MGIFLVSVSTILLIIRGAHAPIETASIEKDS